MIPLVETGVLWTELMMLNGRPSGADASLCAMYAKRDRDESGDGSTAEATCEKR